MSLIGGVNGLLSTLRSTLENGQQMKEATALRTNEDPSQDAERIARMRRESEGIDLQSGRAAETPNPFDRQRVGPRGEALPPNALVDGPGAPGGDAGRLDANRVQGATPGAPGMQVGQASDAAARAANPAGGPIPAAIDGPPGRASNAPGLALGHDGVALGRDAAARGPATPPSGPAGMTPAARGPDVATLAPTALATPAQHGPQAAAPLSAQSAAFAATAPVIGQGPAQGPPVGHPGNPANPPPAAVAQGGAASVPSQSTQQQSGAAVLAGFGGNASPATPHPGSQPPSAAPLNLIGSSSIVVAAQAQGDPAFAQVTPVSPNSSRAAESVVARHVSAIAQAERTDGPQAAARELRARTRDLPTGSASELIANAQAIIERSAARLANGKAIERVERLGGALKGDSPGVARMAADLASGLDAGAAHPQGARVAREVAQAIANAERMPHERLIAFGSGIAFGTGLALPLALIEAFKERNDDRASGLLQAALADGLGRLMKRLNDAVHGLARHAAPLAFEWATWRSSGVSGPDIEKRLRARLAGESGLLDEIDAALEAIEHVGFDVVNALERLSCWGGRSPEILAAWRAATEAPETLFALAQSVAAQHVVVQRLIPGLRRDPPEGVDTRIDPDAAREFYASLGFEREAADILTGVTLTRHTAVQMNGGWMRARRARDRGSEAAFQRLVAYLEGLGTPVNRYIDTITFADLDPDGERPETLFGAPLMRRLDLDLVARDVTGS